MAHDNANYPAFPIVNPETGTLYDGLTKREYFAGLAMQGLISSFTEKASIGMWGSEMEQTTECAVRYADALLLELSK